jgi:hypothetical protein
MSSPPDQPPTEPEQRSVDATIRSKREKRKGAIVATAAVLVSSALGAVSGTVFGLMVGTLVALLCFILGTILTIFERTRLFAVGFLIASAVLLFVTAGACTFAFTLPLANG